MQKLIESTWSDSGKSWGVESKNKAKQGQPFWKH